MMRVYPGYPGPATLRSGLHRQGITVTIGAVLFTIGGFWLMTQSDGESILIGLMLVVVFGFMAGFFLWLLLGHRTGITLDADGFADHSTLYASVGRVRWSEVVAITSEDQNIGNNEKHPALGLHVHLAWVKVLVQDPETLINRSGRRRQSTLRANYRRDVPGTPVWINTTALPLDGPSLTALMNDYLQAWRSQGSTSLPPHGSHPESP